jgi:hypothetical protein
MQDYIPYDKSQEQMSNRRRKSSKIRRQPIHFPIAVAGRVAAAAAAGFLGLFGGFAVALGAAGCGFGERAFGGRRQRALVARLALGFGRVLWLRVGWHRL